MILRPSCTARAFGQNSRHMTQVRLTVTLLPPSQSRILCTSLWSACPTSAAYPAIGGDHLLCWGPLFAVPVHSNINDFVVLMMHTVNFPPIYIRGLLRIKSDARKSSGKHSQNTIPLKVRITPVQSSDFCKPRFRAITLGLTTIGSVYR